MISVTIGGKLFQVDPANPLGQGGEALVFDLHNGDVLKLYRTASDPMYAGDKPAQDAARKRLAGHQVKLREFPKGLPSRVVYPKELALDRAGKVVGYTMPFLRGGEVLLRYSQPRFRQTLSQASVMPILLNLASTIPGIHKAGAVIGDFNDQNVLVIGDEAHVIDADSMQFGQWLCATYTTRFVDPQLCQRTPAGEPSLARAHTEDSDWYAFTAMVAQTLLWTDVYGGIYLPPPGAPKVVHSARTMARIPVWHPHVKYPRPAFPIARLPDDLMHHFAEVFEKDHRGAFPRRLLESVRWTTCSGCGIEHARSQCPQTGCGTAAPAVRPVVQTTQVRGKVTATTVYQAGGLILRAEVHEGKVLWLAQNGDQLLREDWTSPMSGPLNRALRFRLLPNSTFIALGSSVVQLHKGSDIPGKKHRTTNGLRFQTQLTEGAPIFGVNSTHTYWCEDGVLVRDAGEVSGLSTNTTRIGNILSEQTRFWVGDKFGFGFYRASAMTVAFVFDAERSGINDSVPIKVAGKLLDATCTIAGSRAFFFTSTQEGTRTINRCYAVRRDGTLEGTAEAVANDGSWLGSVRGGTTVNGALLMPTDDGVVRVEVVPEQAGQLGTLQPTKTFPDTDTWVDAGCLLLAAADGLYVVSHDARRITKLVIQ